MYENEIVELEDFMFNHYLHHFDEDEDENTPYNNDKERDCMAVADECFEDVPLDQRFVF